MNRGTTNEFQAEVTKSQNMPVHLVAVHLESGVMRMNDGYKTINFKGDDYLAGGGFLGFSDIEETNQVIVSSVTLTLSGIEQSLTSNLLNHNYINKPVTIYMGFLDNSQTLVIEPVLIFEGRLNSPVINEHPDDGKSTISVSATNVWADFTRTTGRHANHEEQQIHFPGDNGFEFAAQNISGLHWTSLNA